MNKLKNTIREHKTDIIVGIAGATAALFLYRYHRENYISVSYAKKNFFRVDRVNALLAEAFDNEEIAVLNADGTINRDDMLQIFKKS